MTCEGRLKGLCERKGCIEDYKNVFCDKLQSGEFKMIKTISIIVKKSNDKKGDRNGYKRFKSYGI
jgi:hypothetical protein